MPRELVASRVWVTLLGFGVASATLLGFGPNRLDDPRPSTLDPSTTLDPRPLGDPRTSTLDPSATLDPLP